MKRCLFVLIILTISFSGKSQCNYTLDMFDSYGDSWNNSFITVHVNGIPTYGPYSALGVSTTENFSVNYLDLVTIEYTPGNWENENSYVLSEGGATLFADGPTPAIGMVFTTTCTSCITAPGVDVQAACDSMVWIDGNTYTSSNNTATYMLTGVGGCDSLVALDLTVAPVDVGITATPPGILSNQFGASYQWLYCDSSYAAMPADTFQLFLATVNGSYAVEVTLGGCTDTSACQLVMNIGLDEMDSESFKLFPNPSNGQFTIAYEGTIDEIVVLDLTGREVEVQVNIETGEVDCGDLEAGRYIVRIEVDGEWYMKDVLIIR
jgi:Secretion system C-terminal sorting domain